MIDKEKLKRRFSRNARQYDQYAAVQKITAASLVEMIRSEGRDYKEILEIGCGTGHMTELLTGAFPSARITAVDIADGMVAYASNRLENSNITFLCTDAEEMPLERKYDLIISNATFQWFNHLEQTLARLLNALTENGLLSFSTFGNETFRELHQAYAQARLAMGITDPLTPGQSFPTGAELDKLCLAAGQVKVESTESLQTEYFGSCLDFLASVKKIGANNSQADNTQIVPGLIDLAMEIYDSTYMDNHRNQVYATYHCLYFSLKNNKETPMTITENGTDTICLIETLKEKVLSGTQLSYDEAMALISIPETDTVSLEALFSGADQVRSRFSGNSADLCSIINAKSGKCSENCKYCAQSVFYSSGVSEYDLLCYEDILSKALEVQEQGVHRFSLVTSGRGIENEKELIALTAIYRRLKKDTTLHLCASHGILTNDQALALKEAGVEMYHHNVETSRRYYPEICTTHTYDDRISTIRNTIAAGMDSCSGGIIGMGETPRDRIEMAIELRAMDIKSVPVNVLNPIPGTPFGHLEQLKPMEILKTMAVFRLLLPDAKIRYAGGRTALGEYQEKGFSAGVNAALVGDFLTTLGSKVSEDKAMLTRAGYKIT